MPTTAWITTSWDDGHPLDMRLAEMLVCNKLKATFYIPRHIPSGVMSQAQVRELSQTFEIGGHTLDHVFLPTVPDSSPGSRSPGAGSGSRTPPENRARCFARRRESSMRHTSL